MTIEETLAMGRRKTSVAAVRLRRGSGKIDINGKTLQEYLPLEIQQRRALAALLDTAEQYDIIIRVKGGGLQGQVSAILLAIARALVKEDEMRRANLKSLGYLTRDPRKRERKKYGLAGARKRFQFSKR